MRIHLIAIGGSAMHNLALAMHQKGHLVSGSDDEIFEPSRGRLAKAGILPTKLGWDANRITEDLDYVILGMHAREDNPELARAQDLGLKVVSYPEFIYENCKDKTRVVIAGSHGKTTITAIVLHSLHFHQRSCDFMVGAQLDGFETMFELSDENEFILLEGDEYLSSPIDRRPKFLHYRPNIALISGIAWDHVNVFPKYEDYVKQFDLLLETVEPGGVVVYNNLDPEVGKVVDRTKNEIKKFPYALPEYEESEEGETALLTEEGLVPLQIFGQHNLNNLEGARWICNQMGLTDEEFYEAITTFKGAALRLQELDLNVSWLRAFRDYAHAPSKVKATVQATREAFSKHRLIACLELHTFSSLNIEFISQYRHSLAAADECIVYFNPKVVEHKRLPALDAEMVKKAFDEPRLRVVTSKEELLKIIVPQEKNPSLLLLMSSGSFDGIDWTHTLKEKLA